MTTTAEKLAAFRASLLVDAEKIVLEEFPVRVIEFNDLLHSERLSYDRLEKILPQGDLNIPIPETKNAENGTLSHEGSRKRHADGPPAKVKKLENGTIADKVEPNAVMDDGRPVYINTAGMIPTNEALVELMDDIRPKIRDSVEDMNKIKMWITLMIPRIEDGNNFGVGIQEETLNEVRSIESEAASFLDQLSRYFIGRAKLLTKVAKYPQVADYRRAILDMDEKQFVNIRLVITEMRNHFATLHDMITKNLEKIKKPRNSNHENMY